MQDEHSKHAVLVVGSLNDLQVNARQMSHLMTQIHRMVSQRGFPPAAFAPAMDGTSTSQALLLSFVHDALLGGGTRCDLGDRVHRGRPGPGSGARA